MLWYGHSCNWLDAAPAASRAATPAFPLGALAPATFLRRAATSVLQSTERGRCAHRSPCSLWKPSRYTCMCVPTERDTNPFSFPCYASQTTQGGVGYPTPDPPTGTCQTQPRALFLRTRTKGLQTYKCCNRLPNAAAASAHRSTHITGRARHKKTGALATSTLALARTLHGKLGSGRQLKTLNVTSKGACTGSSCSSLHGRPAPHPTPQAPSTRESSSVAKMSNH